MSDRGPMALAERGIYVGTCSWTEPTLIKAGTFYPAEVEDDAEGRLRFYAEQFPIVEIDSTYYGPPNERTAGLWVERTPTDFVFDVKAFRIFTQHPTPHRSIWKDLRAELPEVAQEKKNVYLADLPELLRLEMAERFLSGLMPLHSAGKLGLVLFQFPQWFFPGRDSFDHLAWLAERFSELDVSVEFRQELWMDEDHIDQTLHFLADHSLVYVCVDEPQGFKSSVPPVVAVTGRRAAIRFHGRNKETWEARGISAAERFAYDYPKEELEEWVPKIESLRDQGKPVHALMNNCYSDFAIRSARSLADLLEG